MLIKNSPGLFLSNFFSFILLFSLTILNSTYSQSSSNLVSKKGGICFRTDDNQLISRYLEYAALFNSYNQKFTLAINLGLSNEITPEYVVGLKQIQASGHEIMDHTPQHRTNYFTTILPTDYYINHPGVQRIAGNKIELKYVNVNIANAKRSGYVNISRDTVTSTNGIFSSFLKSDCYLYFPSLGQLVFIDEIFGWIDQNRVKVTDFWRNGVDLGTRQNIQFYNFDFNNVHLTIDGLKVLGEESIRLANYYGLERPYSWIQPGGYFPRLYRNEVKQACGDALGYKSAGIFADPSLKVFNEYDPGNDEQYGMSFSDFRDDIWTLEQCKGYIADRMAKHYVVFGGNHFTNGEDGLLGGWSGFLTRTTGLIQWCIANNIPIKTYSEWADILYNQVPNPDEDIFPPLNVDLDGNNIPDGYNSGGYGILRKTDGIPTINDYSYSTNTVGEICSIKDLGGIEKGTNDFEIWTKGAPGDFIEVTFKVGTQNQVYKFPAENSGWIKYNLAQSVNGNTSLNIPNNISLIDVTIRCSNYSSGEVRISGMKLAKLSGVSEYLSVTPSNQSATYTSGNTSFTVASNTSWTVSDDAGWLSITPENGSGNGTITATYTENTSTTQRVGTITISGGGITRIVTVTQAAISFTLAVTPSERGVEHTGGNTTFSVASNTSWTVSDDAGWLSITPENGSGNGTITATYTENTSTTQRVGTIRISGGGITRVVTVIQAPVPFALAVTPSQRSVEDKGGSTTFSVTSNTDWIVSDDAEWLSVLPGSGSGNGTITATYTENPNTVVRSGTITINGGGITRTVKVTQAARPFALEVTPSERSVGDKGGSTTFSVTSNTDWTISEDVEWISATPLSGSGNQTITVTYTDNPVTVQRSGTITVNGGGITRTLTLTQAAQPFALEVTPSERSVEDKGGSTTFSVTSNTDWTISEDVEWLNGTPENGSGIGTITVTYTDNPVTNQRTGTITVNGGGITRTVTLTQAAQPFALEVTPSERSVEDKGGSTTFSVTSNTDWIVSEDVEWLNGTPENGSGNGTITVTYTDNPVTNQRSGIIIVNGGGITDTVLIQQDAKKFLTISLLDTVISSTSGIINLMIDSNTDWELKEDLEWIQLSKYIGTNSDTININYDTNEEITDRQGVISAYWAGDSCTVIMYQSARAYLFVNPDSQFVDSDSGSININVASNITWRIKDSINWISVAQDSGIGIVSLTVIYDANIDSLSRSGTLFFTGDSLSGEFVLVQEGLETYMIIASADPLEGGTTSGSGSYLSGANVKVSAFPSEGWIFKNWKEDSLIVSDDSTFSFISSCPRTLMARFEKILAVTENDKKIPENYELYQNYPNPFNPSTTIKYSVPELSFVTLKVYDILGNEIVTLVNGEQPVGYYDVSFYVSSLSSGIYFYYLSAGSYKQIKKMVVVK